MHTPFRLKPAVCLAFLLFLLLSAGRACGQSKLDSLLKEVDIAIRESDRYAALKERTITALKQQLPHATSSRKLELYKRLFTEYEAYVCDSAMHYSMLSLSLSESLGDRYWITEGKLQLSKVLITSGMYPESIELLNTIDTGNINPGQRISRVNRYFLTYMEWAEYAEYSFAVKYREKEVRYQGQLLSMLQPGTYDYVIEYARYYTETTREFDKARRLLTDYLPQVPVDTRAYAIYTSIMSLLYYRMGQLETHKEYLAISAIADIRAVVKENTSMRSLAVNLLNDGDVERANAYIKKSMEDANFYNARLRNIQISKVYPVFDKAYQLEREKQQRKLKLFLGVISVLSVCLLITVLLIRRQLLKLKEARRLTISINKKLEENNRSLAEANHMKEEYIGRFLNLCSIYINKMENFHLSLTRIARNTHAPELSKILKSGHNIDTELKEFYQEFDNAFLAIFPDFVSQFNKLLPEEDRVVPKFGERLSTELRVYALIRLGITDSSRIAEFLRYSITTIYNYRSRFRNRSLAGKEHFEQAVMRLGEQE